MQPGRTISVTLGGVAPSCRDCAPSHVYTPPGAITCWLPTRRSRIAARLIVGKGQLWKRVGGECYPVCPTPLSSQVPHNGYPILALPLGAVHLPVRSSDKLLQSLRILGERDDTQGDGYRAVQRSVTFWGTFALYRLADAFTDLNGIFHFAAHQQDKLLTPVAGDQVFSPCRPAQHVRYTAQDLVPALVAVAVVIGLKVINVDHGAGKGKIMFVGELEPSRSRTVEVGSAA